MNSSRLALPFVGILGGMGPLAGVDFAAKLIDAARQALGSQTDQEQVPFVLWSVPQIPDRVAPLFDPAAPSPLPAMIQGVRALERAGVDVIAIACNTAHAWHAELSEAVRTPILHLAEEAVHALIAAGGVRTAGILATAATLRIGMYQERLERAGIAWIAPAEEDMEELVKPAIALVKRNEPEPAFELARRACERLASRGADIMILACTELPVALAAGKRRGQEFRVPVLDPAESLARACVLWAGPQGHKKDALAENNA